MLHSLYRLFKQSKDVHKAKHWKNRVLGMTQALFKTEMQSYWKENKPDETNMQERMPDNPYSLMEGISG
jgi:hypothetical protein